MLNYSKDEFTKLLEQNRSLVLCEKITTDLLTPVLATLKISQNYPDHYFLLESVEKGANKGRFSIIGLEPDLVWKCQNSKSYINKNFSENQTEFKEENLAPLTSLRKLIKENQIDFSRLNNSADYPKSISAGIFGYMSYDMVRLMEKIPDNNLPDEINIADSIFMRPQIIIIFDSLFDCAFICSAIFPDSKCRDYEKIAERIKKVRKIITAPLAENSAENSGKINFNFTSNCSEEEYCKMVEKAKEYITNGDIFQALPSQRFQSEFDEKQISPFLFYRALRHLNPSPFLFYLKFTDFAFCGSSPEILSSLKNGKVTIRPLAGTRKRGKNEIEDKKIAAELLQDEKEIAEHLMLIDLGRHDVGRVASEGSVIVTEKMVIENYSHVMHISSNVEGEIKKDLEALDVLISSFPAGTVSGAPKIRAMEIIEELEKVKRSFYAGCVGYFAANGDMETCIALRSALIKNNKIFLQAGAGVVFDSNPESEYQECLNKAAALMKACEIISSFK